MNNFNVNWLGGFSCNELEFEHMDEFPVKYEFFLMDDEPDYDVFNFDDGCSIDYIADFVSTCNTSAISLDLKPLPDSLENGFL